MRSESIIKINETTSKKEKDVIPKKESVKGWHFASLDESDVAVILRFIGYFFVARTNLRRQENA